MMANVVLKDKNGNPVTHEGITEISVPTADGDVMTFTSGASGTKFVRKSVKLETEGALRVSVDFGFKPDFIVLTSQSPEGVDNKLLSPIYIGCSRRFANELNNCELVGEYWLMASTGGLLARLHPRAVDESEETSTVWNVDETGFNVSDKHMLGYYYVYAIGLGD